MCSMAAGLTREAIAALAALARLDLDQTELDLFVRQLGDILAYAEQVQQIDTTGVPPTASVLTAHRADRTDTVRPSLDVEEALANAPDRAPDASFFRVPRVI